MPESKKTRLTYPNSAHHPQKNPYVQYTERYKKDNTRRPKRGKQAGRRGSPASQYELKSSAASFFSALAIKKK